MNKLWLIPIALTFLTGCGYKEVQTEYINTQKELIKLQMEQDKTPLVNVELPNGYKITVANPYQKKYEIKGPSEHPAYKSFKSFTGLANSNLASIIGVGWAGKEMLEAATGDVIGSNNSGSNISTGSGEMSISETTNSASGDMVNGDADKSRVDDNSDNSIVEDNSDNSIVEDNSDLNDNE